MMQCVILSMLCINLLKQHDDYCDDYQHEAVSYLSISFATKLYKFIMKRRREFMAGHVELRHLLDYDEQCVKTSLDKKTSYDNFEKKMGKRLVVKLEKLEDLSNVSSKSQATKNDDDSSEIDCNDNNDGSGYCFRKRPKIISNSRKPSKKELIPYDKKLRIAQMIENHPTWSMQKIKELNDVHHVSSGQIEIWAEQVKKGGSFYDKINQINNWVFAKCLDCQKNNKKFSDECIQNWALEAKKIYFSGNINKLFTASSFWITKFKKLHGITGITKDNLQIDEEFIKPTISTDNLQNDCATKDETRDDTDKLKSIGNLCCNPLYNSFNLRETKNIHIPFDVKKKVVELMRKNPSWSKTKKT
ncbi:uncharacterized protein LOC122850377 [Aphidius gifuensis]|uniref:uncharacterized protein LOC122850377 n=1 Tax=Aphidius gifuensis TaxID=684658 RepID=UPI001CDB5C49|nr:uncharacterized protein LOC122850377 [Aphidius gifuensis]